MRSLNVFRLCAVPSPFITRRVPRPGGEQQRRTSRARATFSTSSASRLNADAKASATEQGSLHGFKILDLSRVLAGPFCTQILADYGADVVKVEQPGKGDETRYWRAANEAEMWATEGISCYFSCVNRNKRAITLDLKSEHGKQILLDLAKRVDVVVDNFVPGKLEDMGIGYDTLSALNPRLIHASISGYGSSGPCAQRAGYDIIAGAAAGLLHITGEPNGPPTKAGVAVTDLCTGLYTHGAIMAALHARHRTGRGQKIDASLFETQLSLLLNVAANWLNLGAEGSRWGTQHPSIVPYGAFRARGDEDAEEYIMAGATNNRQFATLVKLLGMPSLGEDERFSTNDARVENRETLNKILRDVFRAKTTEEWMSVLEGSGLPYGPINNVERAFGHAQTEARDMVQNIVGFDAAKNGVFKGPGFPVKFSDAKPSLRSHPPLLGQHTDEVLREEIGVSEIRLAALRKEGVI